ncbi:hypothetical protein [Methylocapsa sp. S129]|uniref:hypothetical protein n=1 Tax=Methylocapsa sp. S129 TaxID=1641869 RepID=UPI00131B79B6|nr:hypothetical protein [Methylocapsa sp. S129]
MDATPSAGNAVAVKSGKGGALTSGDAPRPIVVVLGMHRSGTSLCSHILSMLGVDMADEVGVNLGNDAGHWERWEIVAFQDEILNLLDRGYSTHQHDFPLPGAWWAEPKVRDVQARIENFLTEKMKTNALFGFKDPRTARLLPLWLQIFRNLNLAPKFILCLRAPSQIARSLQRRDGLDPAAGEYRALNYLVDCFRYIPHHDVCVVDYEEWFENYSDNLHGLMYFLHIEWDQSEADLGVAVSSIVNRDLRHTEERLGIARQPLVRSFHNLASALRKDSSRRGEIDRFVNQFVAFQQLLQPFEHAQRQLGAASREREQALADALAVRAELVAALQARATASHLHEQTQSEALAARDGELEAVRAEHAAATERSARSEAKLAALEAEAQAHAAASQQRERELNESLAARDGELEAVRAEHAAVAERLARSEAKLAAHEAEAQAYAAASQQRERALNEGLAARDSEFEAARAEHAAVAERLAQSETKLAALEAEAQASATASQDRERALNEVLAARAKLEAELGAARADLAAAEALLTEKKTRRAALEATLAADGAAGQQREQALTATLAARHAEIEAARAALLDAERREQGLRASSEAAREGLEAQIRTLRGQLVDAEAAHAKLKANQRGQGDWGAILPRKNSLRQLERKLITSGLFDADWYKSEYKDVADSGRSPAAHYLEDGYLRGYRPNPLFNTHWYLERYEDVRRSGENPVLHYLTHGYREGRDPGPDFQTDFYLESNADVRNKDTNPLVHYLRHGRHEGRLPVRPA